MPPESITISTRQGSLHSSLFKRIPNGFRLAAYRSDTDSTMSGIVGPGRVMGLIISVAGRRLGQVLDRFAEDQLGLGLNNAALRLTSALHDRHVEKK
jgi:hypothetical protein